MSSRQPAPRALFIGYALLLLWLPLSLGGDGPLARAVVELWVFALAIGWLLAYGRGSVGVGSAPRAAWPVLLCCGLWLAHVWLQLLPLPLSLLELLSPEAARAYIAAAQPVPPVYAPLTLDRYGGLYAALKSTAYVLFFALTLVLLDSHERIKASAYVLVLSGVAQALYGGIIALAQATNAHGTFVNRNHFAGYLELCLAVGLGLLIGSLTGNTSRSLRQFARDILALTLSPTMRLRLMLVCMVIGLVLSRSRMGNTAFFASLLVAGAIGLVFSKRATRSMVVLIASVIIIDIVIVGAYFGVGQVVERIEKTTFATEDRDDVAGYALNMWREFPVLGSGLGSFHIVFPKYRGEDIDARFGHAHNDYLQFLAEAGLTGLALLGLIVGLSLYAALRAQWLRGDPLMRGLSFGAIMGITALMIHSWVDFNLQIPANAMTFMYVLGLAWISLHYGRQGHASEAGDEPDD